MKNAFGQSPHASMPASPDVSVWGDSRVEGPYEGKYQDGAYADLYQQAVTPPTMRDVYRQESGKAYSAELGWAINYVEKLDEQLEAADSDDERHAIFAKNHIWLSSNQVLIVKARDYINDKKSEAFMLAVQEATTALANGDMDAYLKAEAALQHTSPIDTEAVRARVAAAYDSTNER